MKHTEDVVSFEVAKLAKKKGFRGECWAWYVDTTLAEHDSKKLQFTDNMCLWKDHNNGHSDRFISAPTQDSLRKWLRNEFNIHVIMYLEDFEEDWEAPAKDHYSVSVYKGVLGTDIPSLYVSKSYEGYKIELDKGLLEALKEI